MIQNSHSNSNVLAMNGSQSNISTSSNDMTNSAQLLPTSSRSSTPTGRHANGLLRKIQTGYQSLLRRFSRPPTELTESDIQMLLNITEFTREEILIWHKNFLGDYPKGFMTRKQFISMYKSLFPKGDAERFARHVFRALDRDNSKKVDFHEFLLGLSMTSSRGSKEAKLQWAFHVFDIDGNGVLTKSECLEVIDAIVRFQISAQDEQQSESTEKTIRTARKSMMKMFDNVNDHQVSTLTKEQFVKGCLNDSHISQFLVPTPNTTTAGAQNATSLNMID